MALPENDTDRIRQLVLQAQSTRDALAAAGGHLHESLDFGTRLQGSMKRNIGLWTGSAMVAGWGLSRLPARTKKVVINQSGIAKTAEKTAKKSLLVAAAGLAFQLARPTLQKYLTQQIHVWMEKHQGGREYDRDI